MRSFIRLGDAARSIYLRESLRSWRIRGWLPAQRRLPHHSGKIWRGQCALKRLTADRAIISSTCTMNEVEERNKLDKHRHQLRIQLQYSSQTMNRLADVLARVNSASKIHR